MCIRLLPDDLLLLLQQKHNIISNNTTIKEEKISLNHNNIVCTLSINECFFDINTLMYALMNKIWKKLQFTQCVNAKL